MKIRVQNQEWRTAFLKKLAKTGIVCVSCKSARVDRSTAYRLRKSDAKFKERWDEAIEAAVESMELECRRRAVDGVKKPVYQGGKLVGEITEFSDTLLIFMLKALRPEKYRDRYESKVSIEANEIKVKLDGVYDGEQPKP